jgi:hypothetical protein
MSESIVSQKTRLAEVTANGFRAEPKACPQQDPLSPLLFVLVDGLLQSIVNFALQNGLLSLPILDRCGLDFSIIQYTDDILLILEACPR